MIQGLGFSWGGRNKRWLRSWLQYADDAAVISTDMKSMQQLLDLFGSWCVWASMEIRLDKCVTFGMHKRNGLYAQYLPGVNIAGGRFLAYLLAKTLCI